MPAIGIDLGTTFSCVAFMNDNGEVEVIHNSFGNRITPSVVSFGEKITYVGEEAVSKRGEDPSNTIYQAKRFIGRKADDKFIRQGKWPFELVSDSKGMLNIRVNPGGKKTEIICPETVSSLILRHLKCMAEKYLQCEVKDAVITVPANFNDTQRQATKAAGIIAGLNVLRIINEPTAAAIAYGHKKKDQVERTILVYDLGGGTFDVSVVQMKGMEATVKATNGLASLGGEDFDKRLFDEAETRFMEMNLNGGRNDWELLQACQKAKIALSQQESAKIELSTYGGKMIGFEIDRETFNDITDDLIQHTKTCVMKTMSQAKIDISTLDDIVLVGGSSRIPRVQELLKEMFGGRQLRHDIHPDEVVSYGAAILARSLSDSRLPPLRLADVTPLSLGIGMAYDEFDVLIPANTSIPCSHSRPYTNPFDNMPSIEIQVAQGERPRTSENHSLGKFDVEITERPAKENKVMVTFQIDMDGILNVSGQDELTGMEAHIVVNSCSLSSDRVEQLRLDAQRRAKEDEEERKRIKAITALQNAIFAVKREARMVSSESAKQKLGVIAAEEEIWLQSHKNSSEGELNSRRSSVMKRKKSAMK